MRTGRTRVLGAAVMLAAVAAAVTGAAPDDRARASRAHPAPLGHPGEHTVGDHLHARPDLEPVSAAEIAEAGALLAAADDPDPTGRTGAGGRAVAHHGDRRPAEYTGPLPEARLYRTGITSLEPTLGVDADGVIHLIAAVPETNFRTVLLRTDDQGATFTDVSPETHKVTADPYVYTDPATGRVFLGDYDGCQLVSYSDDTVEGSWTTGAPACSHVVDHQSIAAGPPVTSTPVGYPNVVYLCGISGGAASPTSTATGCLKSLDGGTSWVPTGGLPFSYDPRTEYAYPGVAGWCDGAAGHLFVGPDGTVYLPKGYCGQPYLAISRDEGLTWTRVQVSDKGMARNSSGSPDHEAGVVVDEDGTIYYVWVARDRLPYLTVSRDGGETWSAPVAVSPPGVVETNIPGIALGAPGKLAIVYMGSTSSPGPPFPNDSNCATVPLLTCPAPPEYADVTWNAYLTVTADALAADPVFLSAPVNDPADPMVQGACGPFRCKAVYDFVDVVVAPDGTPWAVLVDGCLDPDTGTCTSLGEGVLGRLVGGPSLVGDGVGDGDARPPPPPRPHADPGPAPRPAPEQPRLPATGLPPGLLAAALAGTAGAVALRQRR